MSTTQPRRPAGVPVGGQYAPTSRPEPGYALTADDGDQGRACTSCGAATKRGSGLCRRCDPASKANRTAPTGEVLGRAAERSAAAGGPRGGSGLRYDRSVGSVPVDDIRACAFEFVPAWRVSGATGGFRRCANAVTAPATLCHRHGGGTATSLGRSVAKATAEAQRGECWPIAAEHWESADARLEAAEGTLAEILSTDVSGMAKMMVALRRAHRESSVARMSPGNQFLILAQHYHDATVRGLAGNEAVDEALRRASEPHMTASNWAKAGRVPSAGEMPVAALWSAPGRPPRRRDDETDEDFERRAEAARRWRHGAVGEYRLSQTEGEPYEVPADPLGEFRPSGDGDPETALSTMTGLAADMGITVEMTGRRPTNGAYAYWSAAESKIVVWDGIAGGDRRAIAHSLAHELGHARLGHSTADSSEASRVEKETAAESFAALVCAHHGLDTSELSAHYIADWQASKRLDMRATPTKALRSAVEAYDEYLTATEPAPAEAPV